MAFLYGRGGRFNTKNGGFRPGQWIKFYFDGGENEIDNGNIYGSKPTGNYPIMNEDHYDEGDVHYQIYNGEYGFDVNGAGDQTFTWQPSHGVWVYLSVTYSTANQYIKLWVNGQFQETIACPTCTVPITLDSPRIGAWLNPDSGIARSLHGEMSVFRLWNIESTGVDICPSAQTDGLVAQVRRAKFDDS
jgi:hypothetical protein